MELSDIVEQEYITIKEALNLIENKELMVVEVLGQHNLLGIHNGLKYYYKFYEYKPKKYVFKRYLTIKE